VLPRTREIWVRLVIMAFLSTCLFDCRGFGTIWLTRATEEVAGPSFEWRDPVGICYDGKEWCGEQQNTHIAIIFTPRAVASSDATNIRTSIRREGDEIVINGHKW
jgi:hypothetical protein